METNTGGKVQGVIQGTPEHHKHDGQTSDIGKERQLSMPRTYVDGRKDGTARPCAVIGPETVGHSYARKEEGGRGWGPSYYQPLHYPPRNISPRQSFQENMHRIVVPSPSELKAYAETNDVSKSSSKYCEGSVFMKTPPMRPHCYLPPPGYGDYASPRIQVIKSAQMYPKVSEPNPYMFPNNTNYPCKAYARVNNMRYEPYPHLKDKYVQAPRYIQHPTYEPDTHLTKIEKFVDAKKRVGQTVEYPSSYFASHPSIVNSEYPKVPPPVPVRRSQPPLGVQYPDVLTPSHHIDPLSRVKFYGYGIPDKTYQYNHSSGKSLHEGKTAHGFYAQHNNIPLQESRFIGDGLPSPNYGKNLTSLHSINYPTANVPHATVHQKPLEVPYGHERAIEYDPSYHKYYQKYSTQPPQAYNPLDNIPTQFSPNIISPADSNTSCNSNTTTVPPQSLEDGGYVSQCSTSSGRSSDPNTLNRDSLANINVRNKLTDRCNTQENVKSTKVSKYEKKKSLGLREYYSTWVEECDETPKSHESQKTHEAQKASESMTTNEVASNINNEAIVAPIHPHNIYNAEKATIPASPHSVYPTERASVTNTPHGSYPMSKPNVTIPPYPYSIEKPSQHVQYPVASKPSTVPYPPSKHHSPYGMYPVDNTSVPTSRYLSDRSQVPSVHGLYYNNKTNVPMSSYPYYSDKPNVPPSSCSVYPNKMNVPVSTSYHINSMEPPQVPTASPYPSYCMNKDSGMSQRIETPGKVNVSVPNQQLYSMDRMNPTSNPMSYTNNNSFVYGNGDVQFDKTRIYPKSDKNTHSFMTKNIPKLNPLVSNNSQKSNDNVSDINELIDVEAKITQSIITKDIVCNYDIRPIEIAPICASDPKDNPTININVIPQVNESTVHQKTEDTKPSNVTKPNKSVVEPTVSIGNQFKDVNLIVSQQTRIEPDVNQEKKVNPSNNQQKISTNETSQKVNEIKNAPITKNEIVKHKIDATLELISNTNKLDQCDKTTFGEGLPTPYSVSSYPNCLFSRTENTSPYGTIISSGNSMRNTLSNAVEQESLKNKSNSFYNTQQACNKSMTDSSIKDKPVQESVLKYVSAANVQHNLVDLSNIKTSKPRDINSQTKVNFSSDNKTLDKSNSLHHSNVTDYSFSLQHRDNVSQNMVNVKPHSQLSQFSNAKELTNVTNQSYLTNEPIQTHYQLSNERLSDSYHDSTKSNTEPKSDKKCDFTARPSNNNNIKHNIDNIILNHSDVTEPEYRYNLQPYKYPQQYESQIVATDLSMVKNYDSYEYTSKLNKPIAEVTKVDIPLKTPEIIGERLEEMGLSSIKSKTDSNFNMQTINIVNNISISETKLTNVEGKKTDFETVISPMTLQDIKSDKSTEKELTKESNDDLISILGEARTPNNSHKTDEEPSEEGTNLSNIPKSKNSCVESSENFVREIYSHCEHGIVEMEIECAVGGIIHDDRNISESIREIRNVDTNSKNDVISENHTDNVNEINSDADTEITDIKSCNEKNILCDSFDNIQNKSEEFIDKFTLENEVNYCSVSNHLSETPKLSEDTETLNVGCELINPSEDIKHVDKPIFQDVQERDENKTSNNSTNLLSYASPAISGNVQMAENDNEIIDKGVQYNSRDDTVLEVLSDDQPDIVSHTDSCLGVSSEMSSETMDPTSGSEGNEKIVNTVDIVSENESPKENSTDVAEKIQNTCFQREHINEDGDGKIELKNENSNKMNIDNAITVEIINSDKSKEFEINENSETGVNRGEIENFYKTRIEDVDIIDVNDETRFDFDETDVDKTEVNNFDKIDITSHDVNEKDINSVEKADAYHVDEMEVKSFNETEVDKVCEIKVDIVDADETVVSFNKTEVDHVNINKKKKVDIVGETETDNVNDIDVNSVNERVIDNEDKIDVISVNERVVDNEDKIDVNSVNKTDVVDEDELDVISVNEKIVDNEDEIDANSVNKWVVDNENEIDVSSVNKTHVVDEDEVDVISVNEKIVDNEDEIDVNSVNKRVVDNEDEVDVNSVNKWVVDNENEIDVNSVNKTDVVNEDETDVISVNKRDVVNEDEIDNISVNKAQVDNMNETDVKNVNDTDGNDYKETELHINNETESNTDEIEIFNTNETIDNDITEGDDDVADDIGVHIDETRFGTAEIQNSNEIEADYMNQTVESGIEINHYESEYSSIQLPIDSVGENILYCIESPSSLKYGENSEQMYYLHVESLQGVAEGETITMIPCDPNEIQYENNLENEISVAYDEPFIEDVACVETVVTEEVICGEGDESQEAFTPEPLWGTNPSTPEESSSEGSPQSNEQSPISEHPKDPDYEILTSQDPILDENQNNISENEFENLSMAISNEDHSSSNFCELFLKTATNLEPPKCQYDQDLINVLMGETDNDKRREDLINFLSDNDNVPVGDKKCVDVDQINKDPNCDLNKFHLSTPVCYVPNKTMRPHSESSEEQSDNSSDSDVSSKENSDDTCSDKKTIKNINIVPTKIITKGAQKYLPPLDISYLSLKCQLTLPQEKLLFYKKLSDSKLASKNNLSVNKIVPEPITSKVDIPKKVKPKFDDVLMDIDESNMTWCKMRLRKYNKNKPLTSVPKVIIKKNDQGSHYTTNVEETNSIDSDKSNRMNKTNDEVSPVLDNIEKKISRQRINRRKSIARCPLSDDDKFENTQSNDNISKCVNHRNSNKDETRLNHKEEDKSMFVKPKKVTNRQQSMCNEPDGFKGVEKADLMGRVGKESLSKGLKKESKVVEKPAKIIQRRKTIALESNKYSFNNDKDVVTNGSSSEKRSSTSEKPALHKPQRKITNKPVRGVTSGYYSRYKGNGNDGKNESNIKPHKSNNRHVSEANVNKSSDNSSSQRRKSTKRKIVVEEESVSSSDDDQNYLFGKFGEKSSSKRKHSKREFDERTDDKTFEIKSLGRRRKSVSNVTSSPKSDDGRDIIEERPKKIGHRRMTISFATPFETDESNFKSNSDNSKMKGVEKVTVCYRDSPKSKSKDDSYQIKPAKICNRRRTVHDSPERNLKKKHDIGSQIVKRNVESPNLWHLEDRERDNSNDRKRTRIQNRRMTVDSSNSTLSSEFDTQIPDICEERDRRQRSSEKENRNSERRRSGITSEPKYHSPSARIRSRERLQNHSDDRPSRRQSVAYDINPYLSGYRSRHDYESEQNRSVPTCDPEPYIPQRISRRSAFNKDYVAYIPSVPSSSRDRIERFPQRRKSMYDSDPRHYSRDSDDDDHRRVSLSYSPHGTRNMPQEPYNKADDFEHHRVTISYDMLTNKRKGSFDRKRMTFLYDDFHQHPSERGRDHKHRRRSVSPDISGRKWQPFVFLRKNPIVEEMVRGNKCRVSFFGGFSRSTTPVRARSTDSGSSSSCES